MADEKLEGEKLNQLVQLGKKRRLAFAFCPGPKNDHTILIDKIKTPDVIAKTAKKLGSGSKVAYGTFVLNSKIMELTCDQVVPGLAKTLKKFLQNNKIMVKVRILDSDGAVSEGEQAGTSDGARPDPSGDRDTLDARNDGDAIRAQDTSDLSSAELVKRVKALQPAIGAATGDVAERLKKIMIAAVSQITSGDLEKAAQMITALEGATTKTAAPGTKEKTPSVQALAARATALKDMVGPAGEKLSKALSLAVKQLRNGDLAGTETLLTKIEAAVNRAASGSSPSPGSAKWARAETQLHKELVRLAKEKRGDLKAIANMFTVAKKQAAAGNFDMAMAAAARTAGLIKQAAQDPAPAARSAPPIDPNTALYAKAHSDWASTRAELRKQLERLKSTIDTATAGVDGLEDVATQSGVLLDHLGGIDSKLETVLERLAAPKEDTQTGTLKSAARKVIDQYHHVLDTEFFKAVDDNGFVDTNIRATAIASLQQVSVALET